MPVWNVVKIAIGLAHLTPQAVGLAEHDFYIDHHSLGCQNVLDLCSETLKVFLKDSLVTLYQFLYEFIFVGAPITETEIFQFDFHII